MAQLFPDRIEESYRRQLREHVEASREIVESGRLPPAIAAVALMDIARRIETFTSRQTVRLVQRVRKMEIGRLADQTSLLVGWSEENARLLAAMDRQYLNDVTRGLREPDALFGLQKSRAALIGANETTTLNGRVSRVRQQEFGVIRYRWLTRRDSRVRKTHKAHEGKIFRWDSPPADTGHPGEDINCRCRAEPVA